MLLSIFVEVTALLTFRCCCWPEAGFGLVCGQGVFQISAVQPVRYVIEEVAGLFDMENEVRQYNNVFGVPRRGFVAILWSCFSPVDTCQD